MNLERLKERVDYVEGELAELHEGKAEDKGARIENDRNHSDIIENRSRIRNVENQLQELEEMIDVVYEELDAEIEVLQEEVYDQ